MAIRTIVKYPDPVLKERCSEVTAFDADLHQLLDDMAATMATADGIGLAANQVGVTQRVFVMDVPVDQREPQTAAEPVRTGLLEVINPRIIQAKGEVKYEEGCLSFPNVHEWVTRAAEIDLVFQDRDGTQQRLTARGLLAICIQHELDHLEGITFLDRLSPLKRRIVLRDYLRENAEEIADQQHRAKKLRRNAAHP
jgi:peptide deformylase